MLICTSNGCSNGRLMDSYRESGGGLTLYLCFLWTLFSKHCMQRTQVGSTAQSLQLYVGSPLLNALAQNIGGSSAFFSSSNTKSGWELSVIYSSNGFSRIFSTSLQQQTVRWEKTMQQKLGWNVRICSDPSHLACTVGSLSQKTWGTYRPHNLSKHESNELFLPALHIN